MAVRTSSIMVDAPMDSGFYEAALTRRYLYLGDERLFVTGVDPIAGIVLVSGPRWRVYRLPQLLEKLKRR